MPCSWIGTGCGSSSPAFGCRKMYCSLEKLYAQSQVMHGGNLHCLVPEWVVAVVAVEVYISKCQS